MELFHKEIQQKIDPSILAEDLLAEELISQDQFDEIRNLEEKKTQWMQCFYFWTLYPG